MGANLISEARKQLGTQRCPKAPLNGALLALATAAGCLTNTGCGQVERAPIESSATQPNATKVVATEANLSAPEASDALPQVSLAQLWPDGSLVPILGEYIDAVEFRNGQAAVSLDRKLYFVRSDGSRSVLAQQVDGLPTRAENGALVYAARFGETVEIYWLTRDGTNQRLASFRGSATRLSPQGDRRVVFVGAKRGGVSGTWLADTRGARCLTNCALAVGRPWGDAYRAPPGDASKIRILENTVQWQIPEGTWESAPLEGEQ